MMILDAVKRAIALLIVIALACAGFFGWQRWREIQRERHTLAEAEVAREAAVVAEVRDSLADARGELDAALVAGRSVAGVRTAAPIRRPRPSRPTASAQLVDEGDADALRGIIGDQQRALDSIGARGDSIQARLVVVRDTLARVIAAAERYRLFADSTIGAQARQISAMRAVIETPKPRRRWGLGGAAGYCAVYERGDGRTGSAQREYLRYGAGVCLGWSFTF